MLLKYIFVLILIIHYCNSQFKDVRNEADAVKFIAKQRDTNSYHAKAEELEEILYDFVLDPLLYSSDVHDLKIEDDKNYVRSGLIEKFDTIVTTESTLTNGTTKPLINVTTDITTNTTMTRTTMEPTTMIVTEVLMEPTLCVRDLVTLASDILAKEHYALMMLDSYGKPPPGIAQGNVLWLGLYDQCLNQSREINNGDNFDAQYCLVSIVNDSKPLTPILNVGVCVPDSCSEFELTDLLNFRNSSNFTVSVSCHKEFEYSASATACLTFLAFLCFLIAVGTTIEIYNNYKHSLIKKKGFEKLESQAIQTGTEQTKKLPVNEPTTVIIDSSGGNIQGHVIKFLLCFSLLTNGSKILKTKQGEGSLSALNGFRVLSLWWVILGHSFAFSFPILNNPLELVDVISRFSFQAILNGTYSVDSFFFLSGLLVTYLTLKYLQNNDGKLNWAMFYVHRYLRLTPVYAIVIFVFTTLTPHFATGPLYSFAFDPSHAPGVDNQITYCQEYWWTNILYINNFYPTDSQAACVGWGWYLANDMQFYVISPFVIYLLYHQFFAGVALWGVLLLTCFSSLIGESIARNISVDWNVVDINQKNFISDLIYVQPWARISTYLVGMALGYILYKYKGRIYMPRLIVILGWMAATGIALAVVYGLYGTFHGHHLSKGATIIYITLSRFAWAVAIAWVIFACATGYGGPVNVLLSWSCWIPLARISYCAYLLHPIIMFVFYYSLPTTIYFTDFLMVYFFLGHLVLSYAGAFLLSICAEAPFMALEKLYLKREKSV